MKLKYCTIVVENLEESVSFYRDVLGFTVEETLELPDKKIVFLKSSSDAGVELIKEKNTPVGFNAIAIKVKDVKKTSNELLSKNLDLNIEIMEVPNNTLAFIKDPNGVTIVLSS